MIDLLLLFGIFSLGFIITTYLMCESPPPMKFALAFPVGAGMLTFVQFLLSWIHLPIMPLVTLLTLAILIIFFGWLSYSSPKIFNSHAGGLFHTLESNFRETLSPRYAYLAVLGAFLAASWFAVNRSYSTWDAMAIWGAKGYGIAEQGSVFAAKEWGALGLAYPLNIPLIIANFRQASGDILPTSKILFPIFYASFVLLCVEYWRARKIPNKIMLLASMLLATSPILFEQGMIGYVNLPFTTYLLGGTIVSIHGILSSQKRAQILGSFLFGLAAWTRAEGLLYVVACYAGIALMLGVRTKNKIHFLAWFGPFSLIAITWFCFTIRFGSPGESHMAVAIRSAIMGISQGEYNLREFLQIGRYFIRHALEPGEWGFIVPAVSILLCLRWQRPWPNGRGATAAIGLSASFILIVIFVMYYLSSFRENPTLVDFLYMAFNRSLIPFMVMLTLYAVDLLGSGRSMNSPSPKHKLNKIPEI